MVTIDEFLPIYTHTTLLKVILMSKILLFISLLTLIACSQQNNGAFLQIDRFEEDNFEVMLKQKEIGFVKEAYDSLGMLSQAVLGAVPDGTKDVIEVSYGLDWEKEDFVPNVYYKEIPLKEPQIVTDTNGKAKLFIAHVGNNEAIDDRAMGVFDNDQVMQLKELFQEEFGTVRVVEGNSFDRQVNYYWINGPHIVALSVENECLCEDAWSWSGDVQPKAGRSGVLKIFYNSEPSVYTDQFK